MKSAADIRTNAAPDDAQLYVEFLPPVGCCQGTTSRFVPAQSILFDPVNNRLIVSVIEEAVTV